MATSIQRMVIIVLMIDIILAIVGGFVYNTGQEDLEFTNYVAGYQNWSKDFQEIYPSATPDAETVYLDKQFGDSKYGGKAVFNLFGGGIDTPEIDSCEGQSCSNSNIKWIYNIVAFVIAIINILLAYELFQIFYARKHT